MRAFLLALGVIDRRACPRLRGRVADRILDAPRRTPEEASLGPALDRLGGEVVRFRSRDGGRLAARWLTADASGDGTADWVADPHEAILLLHGYTGSIAPDLVEYAPFLRGRRACWGSTSAGTASRTRGRRRSGSRRSRTSRAPSPGSGSAG